MQRTKKSLEEQVNNLELMLDNMSDLVNRFEYENAKLEQEIANLQARAKMSENIILGLHLVAERMEVEAG